jgi:mono/diheme cytochrome c family protein
VLAWDGLVKEVTLKPGETKAYFTFSFTNTSPNEVVMTAVRSSCGCTTAKVPRLPWRLPGGTNASFDVVVDVVGKSGVVTKTVTTETTAGYRYLTTRVTVPAAGAGAMAAADRTRNLQVALADRQAVLKGECAVCHVTPGVGKHGAELYEAVCGVCHEAEHRASMVPNLRAMNKPFRAEDWQRIVREGRKDSLMPAFAIEEDGFLTDAQIESLVAYLTGPFKTANPAVTQRAPIPPPARAFPVAPPPVGTPSRPIR